jgi:hypothetical protein
MREYLVDGGTQRVEAHGAVEEVELHAHIGGRGALPPLREGAAVAFFLLRRSHSCHHSLLTAGGNGARRRDSAGG